MRIVVVTEHAGAADDASRTWVDHLVKALARLGHEAPVLELAGKPATAAFTPGSLRALRRLRPDVIQYVPYSGLTRNALVRLRALRLAAPRAVASIAVLYGVKEVAAGRLLRAPLALASSTRLRTVYDNVARRHAVLPPAVDLDRFVPSEESPAELRRGLALDPDRRLVLHVGNFKHHRNLGALARIARGGEQVAMLASPRYAAPPEVKEELEEAGVKVVHEFVADLPRWYQAADVYLFQVDDLRGATEIPQTVVEAMACGTPVATTRFGALEEFFPAGPGLVYATAAELDEAIERAAREPRGANRRLVEAYSIENLAETVVREYAAV
jgi:glycosyltransferase involved in cell wall biosynthesis